MGFWSAAATAWSLAVDLQDARDAAKDVLSKGGSPLQALRAFAQATDGQLDDKALEALEQGLSYSLRGLQTLIEEIGWVATHEDEIRALLAFLTKNIDTLLGKTIDLGWHAQGWRATLRMWSEEDEENET